MPKEKIKGLPGTVYATAVGWAPDRDVQLGVVTNDGTSLLTILYGTPERLASFGAQIRAQVRFADGPDGPPDPITDADLGRQILDRLEAMSGDGTGADWVPLGAAYNSVWATLDRHSINRLILVLRRARDAAYGRDE